MLASSAYLKLFAGFLSGGSDYYTREHCEPKLRRRYCGIDMIDSRYGPTNDTWGIYSGDLFVHRAKRIIEKHVKSKGAGKVG